MSRIKKYQREVGPGWIHASAGSPAAKGASFGPSTEFGIGVQRVAHFKYDFALDGGLTGLVTLSKTASLPANAIVIGGILNPIIAPIGAGATLAFGTSAGSSAASIKAATAIATFSIDSLVAVIPLFTAATMFKMSAAGDITMTIATANLTAGQIEGFLEYYVPAGA